MRHNNVLFIKRRADAHRRSKQSRSTPKTQNTKRCSCRRESLQIVLEMLLCSPPQEVAEQERNRRKRVDGLKDEGMKGEQYQGDHKQVAPAAHLGT